MTKSGISFNNEPKNIRKTLNNFYYGMIGKDLKFNSPFGEKPCVYADFTSSGRAYIPMENFIKFNVLPYYSNIYSTGVYLADRIQEYRNDSKDRIRNYVNADINKDKIILTGQGTTSAINKLISILKLKEYTQFYEDLIKLKKIYKVFLELNESSKFEKVGDILYIKESFKKLFPKNRTPFNSLDDVSNLYDIHKKNFIYDLMQDAEQFKPIVFYSNMEHNSNYLPWLNIGVKMIQIKDHLDLQRNLKNYEKHYIKIGSFTAASNITGKLLDVDKLAIIMHYYGGIVFFDYGSGAPYLHIDMNSMLPENYRNELGFFNDLDSNIIKYCYKDAIFFSPHKFLGGNNTPGVLICKEKIINNLETSSSQPGGGTVLFVTKNNVHYTPDIKTREEGGTPDIIGSIRIGCALKIRNEISHIDLAVMNRIINDYVTRNLNSIKNLELLNDFDEDTPHLPIYSFLISRKNKYYHQNFISCLLNDLFGIQTRPGCSSAPLYAKILLGVSEEIKSSNHLLEKLEYYSMHNKSIFKPGFTRLNFPYFYPKFIIDYILYAIKFVALYAHKFLPFYKFDVETGAYSIFYNLNVKQKQHIIAINLSIHKFINPNLSNTEHELLTLQKLWILQKHLPKN